MNYQKLIDMIIYNRNGFEKDLSNLSDKDKENVLSAFDWLALEYIKEHISNEMLKAEFKERFGEDVVKEIELSSARNFRLLLVAEQKYRCDTEKGCMVGSSEADIIIYPNNLYKDLELTNLPDDAEITIDYILDQLLSRQLVSDRDCDIFKRYYKNCETLTSIGKSYNICVQRVSRIRNRILCLFRKRYKDRLKYGKKQYELFQSAEKKNINSTSVYDLDLPSRVTNVLLRKGITNIGDICEWSPYQLKSIGSFGPTSAHLLIKELLNNGVDYIALYRKVFENEPRMAKFFGVEDESCGV